MDQVKMSRASISFSEQRLPFDFSKAKHFGLSSLNSQKLLSLIVLHFVIVRTFAPGCI